MFVAMQLPLKIYFEDQNLIVLDKPSGLLSQGEHTGDESLVDILRLYFGRHYVGLVHRLDRNTSGIMVVAKRTKAASRLSLALQNGDLERKYIAWAHGNLRHSAHWSHELVKDERTNTVRVVKATNVGSKSAVLKCEPQAWATWKGENFTLIKFQLETGRSHQIRVQSAAEGFPLLGDIKYARNLTKHAAEISKSFGRPALHSQSLSLPHPIGGALHQYESPIPDDMSQLLKK